MIWTGLVIGFLASFHCLGMCGPIALALPLGNKTPAGKVLGSLLYNVGRILTYLMLGLFFGLIGEGFAVAGFQQVLSIVLGSLLILGILLPLIVSKRLAPEAWLVRKMGFVKSGLSKLFKKRDFFSLFMIGSLNGLLPCGLVYIAIFGAINTGESVSGAAYMMLFGLGTLPMMFVLPLIGNLLSVKLRSKIRKMVPVMIALIGVLFILRGMNLGIPYVSPPMKEIITSVEGDALNKEESACH